MRGCLRMDGVVEIHKTKKTKQKKIRRTWLIDDIKMKRQTA